MHRRRLLKTAAAIPMTMALGCSQSQAQEADRRQQATVRREEALAAFPYEVVKVSGVDALRTWEELSTAQRGVPVVIGDERAFDPILDNFHPEAWRFAAEPVLAETLAKADRLTHPESLNAYLRAEEEQVIADLRQSGITFEPDSQASAGDWPETVAPSTGPTVILDFETGKPSQTVYIVMVPTQDWTTVPAYLRWGGWNANPLPEYHVAALRSWRDRYGAELVGLGFDTMNIRAARRPETREEALLLAREQYAYCSDLVDQGYGTLSRLAASLQSDPWWWFWWD